MSEKIGTLKTGRLIEGRYIQVRLLLQFYLSRAVEDFKKGEIMIIGDRCGK